jgi:hypothetical protein
MRPRLLWAVPLCLLVLAAGCKRVRREVQHVEVSGQVLYQKQPVTGGQVTFVTDDGFSSTGRIDPKGQYTIKAPVGHVKITVDNRMLSPSNRGANMEATRKGAGRPDASQPEPIKGTYKQIPSKYYLVESTDLTWTVPEGQQGSQTHDLELNDTPPS